MLWCFDANSKDIRVRKYQLKIDVAERLKDTYSIRVQLKRREA